LIKNKLLADIEFDDNESQTKDDEEDSNENPIDPFSTKQFQSKRRRGFRKKPRPFSEDDIEALQQLSCAKAFTKFHSRMTREAQTDESIGDYLKACSLLATKLRHCKNEFLDGDNADQQIENYYKDRLEEYSTLSKQEFLTLAERYKSDIHHTIDKWLKKRSKSRSHAKKANPGEYITEMSIAADDQPLPRWYSKKCFDFPAFDWFELELLLLIDLIC
jgi:hypothetical protein